MRGPRWVAAWLSLTVVLSGCGLGASASGSTLSNASTTTTTHLVGPDAARLAAIVEARISSNLLRDPMNGEIDTLVGIWLDFYFEVEMGAGGSALNPDRRFDDYFARKYKEEVDLLLERRSAVALGDEPTISDGQTEQSVAAGSPEPLEATPTTTTSAAANTTSGVALSMPSPAIVTTTTTSRPAATTTSTSASTTTTSVPPAVSTTIEAAPILATGRIGSDCRLDGIELWGIVYVTESPSFADFWVATTATYLDEDITVYPIDSDYFLSADSCGIWAFTTNPSFADFSVYFTTSTSFDFSVYFVTNMWLAGV